MLSFLKTEGVNVRRGYGTGPSRKLELVTRAFNKLGIGSFTAHNIKRGHYLFENVSNLQNVIHKNEEPSCLNSGKKDGVFRGAREFKNGRSLVVKTILVL